MLFQAIPIAASAMLMSAVTSGETAGRYAEGQVWEYRTRASDSGSLLKIQRVATYPVFGKDRVYHISVVGVRFGNLPLAGEIGHLPVSRKTLDASVTQLSKSTTTFPDVAEGIEEWRRAEGGIFTIKLSEIVDSVEKTVAGSGEDDDRQRP